MNFQKFLIKTFVTFVLFAFVMIANAQEKRPTPTLVIGEQQQWSVAAGNNLYCAGYVQTARLDTAPRQIAQRANKIVGGEDEQEQFVYSLNDFLYINGGANKGVQLGDLFTVIRPRGQVETGWSRKNGLGVYVQELGVIEVVKVKPEVSVARVKAACEDIRLGDLIHPAQVRVSPLFQQRPALDLFGEASGKQIGRIFMARGNQEMLAREQIIYVDLGAEDNVSVGDYLTIYRPLGKGHLFVSDEDELVAARDYGFQSDEYKGGKFSNNAPRKYGSQANRKTVDVENAKAYRPSGLRKVVGEGVILNVRERTATVVITRTRQEIHTGDMVEVQ